MSKKSGKSGGLGKPETILTHTGRNPAEHFGFVNTPVFRGSTVLFETIDDLDDHDAPYRYGRNDNPTNRSVEAIITELEGAAGTVLASSGLAAITTAILSVVASGDEVLVTDTVYEPTRNFCHNMLSRFGVSTRFYDPRIGARIEELCTDKTKLIFVESPGSLTFEVQDLPAIVAVAKKRGIIVMVDNSWATPLFHRPLELGADIVVHAGTKMFVGHSDAMFGTASANAELLPQLKRGHRLQGVGASPDDAYLAARGLRTLAIRMKEHSARSTELAAWLEQQPLVEAVYHPALPSHPDHEIWKRDFTGAGSLFSVLLKTKPRHAVAAMVNHFELFGMGYSWGGYESLCLPIHPERIRTATHWDFEGCMFRIHVGLEDMDDLKTDMAAALGRYQAATA
ncbi:MAG: Cystathionine beta-lyase [Devosia sp.]|uniref:cystathionine beta-lyase n=1 Tax=Devosia sp. TaxID=1871048 RepID=UPI0026398FCC|nr:cystathionine beta-lyase [Devosia sp.]MDB5540345.1 Cystathionine beta-lyase [Devosia sp.]